MCPLFTRLDKGQKMEHLLEVKHLSVSIDSPAGEVQAVRDVSFALKKGEVLAIVGESGCGKSVLCKSIMKLMPKSARIKSGSISINGQDIKSSSIGKWHLGIYSWKADERNTFRNERYGNLRRDCDCKISIKRRSAGTVGSDRRIYDKIRNRQREGAG